MKDMTVMVANLMAVAARTAPKAGGKDFLEIVVIDQDDDLKKIAQAMKDYAPRSTNEAYWLRRCGQHRELPGPGAHRPGQAESGRLRLRRLRLFHLQGV